MEELGVDAYRFSVSWARIIPDGNGEVNDQGLQFYRGLIEELLDAGIEPWICLYHWNLPQALQGVEGWANSKIVEDFERYAELLEEEFGGKVENWVILNEPWVVSNLGYLMGEHAPGVSDHERFLKASHNPQLAQGRAIETLRKVNENFRIDTVLNLAPIHPASDDEKDEEAADRMDQYLNRWYLDPLFKGEYPPLATRLGLNPDPHDLEAIRQPVDFLGINYYTRQVITHDPKKRLQSRQVERTSNTTEMGWEIYPAGLEELLLRLKEDYDDPILYVTENGAAFDDKVTKDGRVEDDDRIRFLRDYIEAASRAREKGADLQGYFVWTLMDNFEWAFGHSKKFGLIKVDFDTFERSPKKRYYWYKKTIENNGPVPPNEI